MGKGEALVCSHMPKAARKEHHLDSLQNIYPNYSVEKVCEEVCFSSLWLLGVRGRTVMLCKN